MKKLVVLSGAGMSAESGIPTFRGMGGLWEKFNVTDLASPEGWAKDPRLVLRFYNERRKGVIEAQPNAGHLGLVELEEFFRVNIVTQNIDDLHERAGSSNILHLHGEIRKSRSTKDESKVYPIQGTEINWGDECELGSQLRPHVVWFGEEVPALREAIPIVEAADILVIIGTSLGVYPAAGLVDYTQSGIPIYVIDPESVTQRPGVTHIAKGAGEGVAELKELITSH